MARKREIVHNVPITGISKRGDAVGRDADGMVYFVSGAVPGDVVNVWVKKKNDNYNVGVVDKVVSASLERVESFCDHFGECGGCKWQSLDYSSQLNYKTKAVDDALSRIAHVVVDTKNPILGCDKIYEYRNKMEYSFSERRWVPQKEMNSGSVQNFGPATGFHRAGAYNMVVQIDKCHLQDDITNKIRNFVHRYAIKYNLSFYNSKENKGLLRNLRIRNTTKGDWMIVLIAAENNVDNIHMLLDKLIMEFDILTSVYYVINENVDDSTFDLPYVLYHGNNAIQETLGHITYKIGPKSFFQTNSYQAKLLYDLIVEVADLKGEELVYDLYTGLGSIALYIADKCKKVIGIEEVAAAIDDANDNKLYNGVENVEFVVGDCKEVFTDQFITKYGKPDLIIVDPPRAGLHKDVVMTLHRSEVDRIVYVSCNPSSQARDIAQLADRYHVALSQPVDMFPHTHHIENIALLVKKEAS